MLAASRGQIDANSCARTARTNSSARPPPQIASNDTWSEMRAMVTAFLGPDAKGDANDMLAQLEAGRPTAHVTPLANMTDRPYWWVGACAMRRICMC